MGLGRTFARLLGCLLPVQGDLAVAFSARLGDQRTSLGIELYPKLNPDLCRLAGKPLQLSEKRLCKGANLGNRLFETNRCTVDCFADPGRSWTGPLRFIYFRDQCAALWQLELD